MKKHIAYYVPRIRWPESIWEQFGSNLTKIGTAFFEEETESWTEKRFIKACSALGIPLIRKTVPKYTGKDLYDHPFHCLEVRHDRDYHRVEDFIDFSSACGESEKVICSVGARQKYKVTIDPQKSKELDIMTVPQQSRPRICLISRRLKELLESINATGCEFVPCLQKGREYSEKEKDFAFRSKELEEQAIRFQLLITAGVKRPASIGKVGRIVQQCPLCKTIYYADFEKEAVFHLEDLNETDFQETSEYETDNVGTISIPGEFTIISSRVLRLLLENKITGLSPRPTDLPIKRFIVVII